MSWISILKLAAGISSALAAICFLGALFFYYATRRNQTSITGLIGHTQLNSNDVIKILQEFKDDPEGRLKALQMLMHGRRDQAQQLLEKLRSGIDIDKISDHQNEGSLKSLKATGAVALVFGLLLLIAGLIEKPINQGDQKAGDASVNGDHGRSDPNVTNALSLGGSPITANASATNSFPNNSPEPKTNNQNTCTIRKGETLAKIALRYGITIRELLDNNDISPSKLKVGQILVLPDNAKMPEDTTTTSTP